MGKMSLDRYIFPAQEALGEENPFIRVSYIIAPYINKNQITLVSDAAKSALKEGEIWANSLSEKLKDEFKAEFLLTHCVNEEQVKVSIDYQTGNLPFDVRSKFPYGIAFLAMVRYEWKTLEKFPALDPMVPTENGYAQIKEIALDRENSFKGIFSKHDTDTITLDFLTKTAGIKLKDANITKAWETELGKRWLEAAKKLGFEPSDNRADS